MGNGASNARLRPRRVTVFLEGKPDVKMRVVVPGSWEEFIGAVQGKLGIPYSTSVKVRVDGSCAGAGSRSASVACRACVHIM